ncbi:hypothetical protein N431DRAFT_465795 [Stipitochalara longipes BDJ]|nr:hypothetical protein N431DRAFT_465795 [Stipitochalara longipes BDJ]
MRLIIHSLLALATVIPTQAFTNGSLIPSYFCNPKPDGLPKSLGELIPFTVKDQNTALTFNTNVTANLNVVPVTNSKPGNTGYMLASFHNTVNRITPLIPGIAVTLANNATALQAGKPNQLVLSSMAAGIALDGALLHARNATGTPVGSFTDTGGIFVAFPGCGKNKQGQFNGVVHSQLITCNETYTMLSYNAPKCGNAPITLGGLSVTDNGFGVWNVTFPVVGGLPLDGDGDCDADTTKSFKALKGLGFRS